MIKFNQAFCKNVWYAIHGVFWQLTMSVLAFYNMWHNFTELAERFEKAFPTFCILYFMCQIAPLLKLWRYRLMWSGLDAGSGNLLRTIALSSRTSAWLVFEISSRTQAVFGKQAGEGASSTRRRKNGLRMRTRFLLLFREECKRVGLAALSEETLQDLARPRRRWCRRRSTIDCVTSSAKKAESMAAKPWCFWFTLWCNLVNPYAFAPLHPALPNAFVWSLKTSLWSCLFHVMIYWLSVRAHVIDWYSPTWVLKVLMSLVHLYSLRRASSLRSPWPLTRFGVLEQNRSPWPVAELWQHWSHAASQAFAWDEELDWWELLHTGAANPCRAPKELHTNSGVVGDTLDQILIPQST